MQNTTQSLPRGQWGRYTYQKIYLRPGVGVHLRTVSPLPGKLPAHLEGVKRGKVVGFSKESAARLREVLYYVDTPPEKCFGLAFTSAPWVRRKPEDAWHDLKRHLDRIPGLSAAIWRKEVTARGLTHYHAVVWCSDESVTFKVWHRLTSTWCRLLLRDGVCPGVAYLQGVKAFRRKICGEQCWPASIRTWNACGLDALQGVNCHFSQNSRKSNLVRMDKTSARQYLCDHTSKHKAYQAKTTGRAWGYIRRENVPRVVIPGISLEECPRRLLADIRKALSKMSRYWWKDSAAPFGYRWSHPRSFRTGSKVLFRPNAPEVVDRLVRAWEASQEAGEGFERTRACP